MVAGYGAFVPPPAANDDGALGGGETEAQAHDTDSHGGSTYDSHGAPGREGQGQAREGEGGLRVLTSRWAALTVVGMMGVAGYHQAGQSSTLYKQGVANAPGATSQLDATGKYEDLSIESTEMTELAEPPHILFMLVDDLGWNDIGYNSDDMKGMTPIMDALAAGGVTLMNYYAQHLCTPSRAALMTGKYPIKVGLHHDEVIEENSAFGLPVTEQILPQYLKLAGYVNYAVGKWHLGHMSDAMLPTNRGFDSFMGFLGDQEFYYSHESCHTLNNKNYYDMIRADNTSYSVALDKQGNYSAQVYRNAVDDIVAQHAAQHAGKPAFLYYSFQNVHAPLKDEDMPDMAVFSESEVMRLASIKYKLRRKFAKLLVTLDHNVGHAVDAFKDAGMWDNTILIMSSDNGACDLGGGYNTPLKGGKHFLFEGGLRVHGFVSGGLLPPGSEGTVYNGLTHISDWMPTILYKAGVEAPDGLDGINQWNAMTSGGTVASERTEIFHNLDYWSFPSSGSLVEMSKPRGAIRVGDMKYIHHHYGMPTHVCPNWDLDDGEDGSVDCSAAPINATLDNFLFNITADPTESTNLYYEFPEIAVALEARMFEIYDADAIDPVWADADEAAFTFWDIAGGIVPWAGLDDAELQADAPQNGTAPTEGSGAPTDTTDTNAPSTPDGGEDMSPGDDTAVESPPDTSADAGDSSITFMPSPNTGETETTTTTTTTVSSVSTTTETDGEMDSSLRTSLSDVRKKAGTSGWHSPRSYGWWGNHGTGPKPVRESTMATTALLSTLHELNQVNTMGFGQQYANYVGQEWPWFQYWGEYDKSDVYADTGDYPLVFGYNLQDFWHNHLQIENYITWAAEKKAVIQFMWLADNPFTSEPGDMDAYNTSCGKYEDMLHELLPDGELNSIWTARLDTLSELFTRFTFPNGEAIPFVFRIFHEGTAAWYWWGTSCGTDESYKALWRYTVNYLHDIKGHKNILWEYAPSKPSMYSDAFADRYPGDDYVDVVSFDRYAINETYDVNLIQDCEFVVEFAEKHNKVATLAETGILYGIQNISNTMWYESDMLKPIMQHCPQLAYALTFTDFSTTDYWVPLPGQKTYPGFMKFYEDEHTMFLNDTLWKDTTYYQFISGFDGSSQSNLELQSRETKPVQGPARDSGTLPV